MANVLLVWEQLAKVIVILLFVRLVIDSLVVVKIGIIFENTYFFYLLSITQSILVASENLKVLPIEVNSWIVRFIKSTMSVDAYDVRGTIFTKGYYGWSAVALLSRHGVVYYVVVDTN